LKLASPIAGGAKRVPLGAGGVKSRLTRLRLMVTKSGSLILGSADQAIVSLSSFATFVMVGRWTDPSQLGAYAVALSVLALALAMQEALVSRPYIVHLHRPLGTTAEHAFSVLILSLLLGALTTVVVGAIALLLSALQADRGLIGIVWALAGALPLVLLREFARRFAFAHLNVSAALKIDAAAAVLMVGTISALGWAGELSAARALIAVGLACGLATLGWLSLAKTQFAWSAGKLLPELRRCWGIGKWFLSGQLAAQAQGYMVPWLALVLAGAAMTGIYTACASVVAFANPFIYGVFNVLTPKYVSILKAHGMRALRHRVACDALLLAVIMIAFAVVVSLFGDRVMHLLYQHAEYTGYGHVLVVLSVAALVAVAGVPASLALAAAEHARAHAAIKALGAVLTVLLVSSLLPWWGILGASYGVLVVETVVAIGQWVAFSLLVRRGDTAHLQATGACVTSVT
jgi:O-antigen/teichoic acid export membrane protein